MSNRARGARAASFRPLARIRALAPLALLVLAVNACATSAPSSSDRPRLRVRMTNDFQGRLLQEHPNDFMAEGGDGFEVLTRASGRDATEIVDLDALVAYVQGLPQPIEPPSDQRLRAAREPSTGSMR